MELNKIYNMDAFEGLKLIPDKSVNMAILDPPYNIKVVTKKNNKATVNEWDKIDNYQEWMRELLKEVSRVLTDNGVLYLWHNDMQQIAEIMHNIASDGLFAFRSFCIWDKGESYRARSWKNRRPDSDTALRRWFNICEYCLHFFKISSVENTAMKTGLDYINSNPECYKPLKEWYRQEMSRLQLKKRDIAAYYTNITGKKPHMLRHYFQNSQFEIPTQKIWETVYMPLGFNKSYETLRQEYEALRQEYEALRHVHKVDSEHSNIWHRPVLPSNNRLHTCQKPLDIIERLINVSSNEGAIVLDPFMGSGTTAIAAINTNRQFIGFEKGKEYFDIAQDRINQARAI